MVVKKDSRVYSISRDKITQREKPLTRFENQPTLTFPGKARFWLGEKNFLKETPQ